MTTLTLVPSPISNAHLAELPSHVSRNRFVADDGRVVEVTLDWRVVRALALGALRNQTGRRKSGPVVVREIRA